MPNDSALSRLRAVPGCGKSAWHLTALLGADSGWCPDCAARLEAAILERVIDAVEWYSQHGDWISSWAHVSGRGIGIGKHSRQGIARALHQRGET